MKVMLHQGHDGKLFAYVAKKDLEEEVVSQEESDGKQILTLANGWQLAIAELIAQIKLPKTIDAKRL